MDKIKLPKKLIEVALPLDDINAACAHEKQPGIGPHPRSLHWWWARRPLAAAKAFLFAQLVNDPGYHREIGFGVDKKAAELKRERLFQIIRDLVKWENVNNEDVLNRARNCILESWHEICKLNRKHPDAMRLFNPDKLPALHDPFAGGGAIPLEAQRLGLKSCGTDLNPVAVIINKSMIEIPLRFSDKEPVCKDNGLQISMTNKWSGFNGLAEDILRYGELIRSDVAKILSEYFPSYLVTENLIDDHEYLKPLVGSELTPYTYIWVRTVKSPSPAAGGTYVPLSTTFALCTKTGKEAYIKPIVTGNEYRFTVALGASEEFETAKKGTKQSRGSFKCIITGAPITAKYLKEQGKAGNLKYKLMCIVTSKGRGKIYLPPTTDQEAIAFSCHPHWDPNNVISGSSQYIGTSAYGMNKFSDLFTARQKFALNTFITSIKKFKNQITRDALEKGFADDGVTLSNGGCGAFAYSEAMTVYLSLAISRMADFNSQLSTWKSSGEQVMHGFTRQAISMTWDFAESNLLIDKGICWKKSVQYVSDSLMKCCVLSNSENEGVVDQKDARYVDLRDRIISTDPPYYDNIPYADLADFFYVWLRESLCDVYPEIFKTISVPKLDELVAFAYRHESKDAAGKYFMEGMKEFASNVVQHCHPAYPITIYYAFKQSDTRENNTSSSGWENFLEALIESGLEIVGTWPTRSELSTRIRGLGSNALASSIVLVCHKRTDKLNATSKREFQRELREAMPESLEAMIGGSDGASPIVPVDLAQAAIGPGMAIFSKYEKVLNQDGSKMSVHDALILINRAITEYLNPSSGSFDADTLFCDDWFSQYGWGEGLFGEADTLARAKGTSVDGVREAGVIISGGGKVRLLKWQEYPSDWDPQADSRTPVWEACHHMIRALNLQGESKAGNLLARMPERGEQIRQLAYHLYTLCERKKWAEEARAYNELIGSWHAIVAASHEAGHSGSNIELRLDI